MPIITSDPFVDEPKKHRRIAFILLAIGCGLLLIFFLWAEEAKKTQSDPDQVTVSAWLSVICLVWSYFRFRRAKREKQLLEPLPHSYKIQRQFFGKPYTFSIDVQWPMKFDAQQKSEADSPYAHLNSTRSTKARFESDITAALTKYLETAEQKVSRDRETYTAAVNQNATSATKKTLPPPPEDPQSYITISAIEECIKPAIRFLQQSLEMTFVKYDCILIERPPEPPEPAPKPDPTTGSVPDGYIGHAVVTPIGVILYAYKPFNQTAGPVPDMFFEDQTDKALIRILKNNPKTDLRTYQVSLKIVIVRIDPKQGEEAKGAPVGNDR